MSLAKTLSKRIDADLIVAIKARDKLTTTVLRGVKSDLKNAQIAKGTRGEDIKDEDVITILSSAAKKRRESIEAFTSGGRDDLVAQEKSELKIIESYLPEQMSEDEIRVVIKRAIEEHGIDSPAKIGLLMKEIMPKFKGKADGKLVNKIAREALV
ncbi:MAG: GatB/YqeY domain-containing protein [candidate division Zixibacteria bacterium]|nr:GatB/YqeY domain-containing protein [candidate division Zixibacteria bacterium]